jgi:D-alanyl-D-alanine endopeptidase (penicillin-binding protein 7)
MPTLSKSLLPNGLPVTPFRPRTPRSSLRRLFRAGCALAALLTVAVPPEVAGATRTQKGASQSKKLTLKASTKRVTASRAARLKRARLARARRAAAQAAALREAKQPRFRLDDTGALVPDIRAEAAIIYNPATGEVLWEHNSLDQRSIASITKVMTARVVVDDESDLGEPITIEAVDTLRASTTYLRRGDVVTRHDLLHLLLIGSDNAAARALARVSPHGATGFVDRMNATAAEMGLTNTTYVDSSGLLSANVSSAFDMARLITEVSADERIGGVMRKERHTLSAGTRTISVGSTNQLVTNGDVQVEAGKTGFIRKAGYCLATLLRLPEGGPQVAVVVLGARSNAGRFWETRHLFNWLASKAEDMLGATVEAATPDAAVPVPKS